MGRLRRRPTPLKVRSSMGGLTTVVRHGPGHMAAVGRLGGDKLDAKIAKDAGIPDDLDREGPEFRTRMKAARTLYYRRLAEKRWAGHKSGGR